MSDGNNGSIVYPEDKLAELLVRAADESSAEVLGEFYRTLLKSIFFVPERVQEQPLTNQPEYPTAFLNILGVQNKDSVFVPLFSSEDRVEEWSGHQIRVRSMSLPEILDLLPAGWWLILNPNSEGEKDFSPWEIDLLRGGEANVPALIDEVLVEDVIEDIEMQSVSNDQHRELKSRLIELAKNTPAVEQLILIKETGKTISNKETSSLILGILIAKDASEEREDIQEEFSNLSALILIGADKIKVRSGDGLEGNLMLGIFDGYEPFYRKEKSSWLSKLFQKK